jgi:hypothetical protein
MQGVRSQLPPLQNVDVVCVFRGEATHRSISTQGDASQRASGRLVPVADLSACRWAKTLREPLQTEWLPAPAAIDAGTQTGLRRQSRSIIWNVHWLSPMRRLPAPKFSELLIRASPAPHLQKFGAGALVVAAGRPTQRAARPGGIGRLGCRFGLPRAQARKRPVQERPGLPQFVFAEIRVYGRPFAPHADFVEFAQRKREAVVTVQPINPLPAGHPWLIACCFRHSVCSIRLIADGVDAANG